MHQRLADLRSVIIVQPFLRDRRVKTDLTADDLFDIFHSDLICKIQDIFYRKAGPVHGVVCFFFCFQSPVQEDFPVFFHFYDIGMLVRDHHFGIMSAAYGFCRNIEIGYVFCQRICADPPGGKFFRSGDMFRSDLLQDFQSFVRVAAYHTENSGDVDPFQTAGIGNGDALDVFDDIAA